MSDANLVIYDYYHVIQYYAPNYFNAFDASHYILVYVIKVLL